MPVKNSLVSIVFEYNTDYGSQLDNMLYEHVRKTTTQLGLPMPAARHVHRMSPTQVWIEQISFVPTQKFEDKIDGFLKATPAELQKLQSCGLCSVTLVNYTKFRDCIDRGMSCSAAASFASMEALSRRKSYVDRKFHTNMNGNNTLNSVHIPQLPSPQDFSSILNSSRFNMESNYPKTPPRSLASTKLPFSEPAQHIIYPTSLANRISPRSGGAQASRKTPLSGGVTLGRHSIDVTSINTSPSRTSPPVPAQQNVRKAASPAGRSGTLPHAHVPTKPTQFDLPPLKEPNNLVSAMPPSTTSQPSKLPPPDLPNLKSECHSDSSFSVKNSNGTYPQKTTFQYVNTNIDGKRKYDQVEQSEQSEAVTPLERKRKTGSNSPSHSGHLRSVTEPFTCLTTEPCEDLYSKVATLEELVKGLKGQIGDLHSVIDGQRGKIESQKLELDTKNTEIDLVRANLEDERERSKILEHEKQIVVEELSLLQKEVQDPFIVPSLLRVFLKFQEQTEEPKPCVSSEVHNS